jgi:hypothetical protein
MDSTAERLRRVRLNDHTRYLRNRYGYELPDDDAGRDDLYELLLVISLGEGADRKMRNAIGLWAPWMSGEEANGIIGLINRTPDHLRKRTKHELGQIWGLTYEERQRLGIRTVAPCDLTEEEFQQRRKARKSFLQLKRRLAAGRMTRAQYRDSLANSLSRTKPWEAEGKSRAQWYRLRAKQDETRCGPNKAYLLQASNPVSLSKVHSLKSSKNACA